MYNRLVSRPLRFVPSCLAVVLAALGVGACSTPRYDVEVSFASDVTPSDVRFVELQLLPSCPSEADVAAEAMVSLWQQRALDLEQLVRRAVMAIACGLFRNAHEEMR